MRCCVLSGRGLGDAAGAVEIYTGLEIWQRRELPGIESAFIGDPTAPDVVAIYELDDAGWRVRSVTSCR